MLILLKKLESIFSSISPHIDIKGDVVLLMDDVTTTGTSLEVCRDILMENGAERVAMFAIGKTV